MLLRMKIGDCVTLIWVNLHPYPNTFKLIRTHCAKCAKIEPTADKGFAKFGILLRRSPIPAKRRLRAQSRRGAKIGLRTPISRRISYALKLIRTGINPKKLLGIQ